MIHYAGGIKTSSESSALLRLVLVISTSRVNTPSHSLFSLRPVFGSSTGLIGGIHSTMLFDSWWQ